MPVYIPLPKGRGFDGKSDKPKYLTRGLMVAYLRKCFQQQYFSVSYDLGQNSQKNRKGLENST